MGAGSVAGAGALATRHLLAIRHCGTGGVAHTGGVQPGIAIGVVARPRAHVLSRGGVSFLVAGHPAVAKCSGLAKMVNPPLPVFGHIALRHSFCLPDILRTSGVRGVPQFAPPVRVISLERPRVRRGADVDLRHARIPAAGGPHHIRVARAKCRDNPVREDRYRGSQS